MEIPLNLETFTGKVLLRVQIQQVLTNTDKYVGQRFVPITSAGFSSDTPLREVNRVNTKYIATNSITLSRSPKIGSAFDKVAIPAFVENGIFEKVSGEIRPTPLWQVAYDFENDVEVYTQLAAGIHMQMLPYYTKPNRVINGTIVNRGLDYYNPRFFYDGREYILLSGSYNCISGHLEGAVLREFARYDDIWQGANIPEIKEESTNK